MPESTAEQYNLRQYVRMRDVLESVDPDVLSAPQLAHLVETVEGLIDALENAPNMQSELRGAWGILEEVNADLINASSPLSEDDDRQLVGRVISTLRHLIAKELPGKDEH
jgi:hypothetical protein